MPASTNPPPAPPARRVVDVSEHNAPIDWAQMRQAGVTHAYIRCTRGSRHLDRAYVANTYGAAEQGILFGLYHYFMHHEEGEQQARWFLHAAGGNFGGLPPVLDVEGSMQYRGPDDGQLQRWLETVRAISKRQPAIYTSAGYWNAAVFGRSIPWAKEYPLWVAHWTRDLAPQLPHDWNAYWLWQYGHAAGRPYGVSSTLIDLNRFNQDLAPRPSPPAPRPAPPAPRPASPAPRPSPPASTTRS